MDCVMRKFYFDMYQDLAARHFNRTGYDKLLPHVQGRFTSESKWITSRYMVFKSSPLQGEGDYDFRGESPPPNDFIFNMQFSAVDYLESVGEVDKSGICRLWVEGRIKSF